MDATEPTKLAADLAIAVARATDTGHHITSEGQIAAALASIALSLVGIERHLSAMARPNGQASNA